MVWTCCARIFNKAKKKYRGMFEIQKSPETWQVQECVVSTLEQMHIPNGTWPGVRRSKRPLLASRARCKCSIEPSRNYEVKSKSTISGSFWIKVLFNQRSSPWATNNPCPPPPRGNFRGYDFLKAYEKCYKMSHVCTLAIGAFRIFGVKRENLCKKSLKIGIIFNFFLEADNED